MMNITVEQGDFEVAEAGFTLETGAAGPCILIGIYDRVLKKAYLIHEDSASHKGKLFQFIETVKKTSDPKNLIAKVRGGAGSENDPDFDVIKENRDVVRQALSGFLDENQIDLKWRQSCMEIDTVTGKFRFRL